MFDDEALAALLWDRLKRFYQTEKLVGDDSETWVIEGLNERFRLCRYEKGGKFSPHCDGRRLANINEQSFMALNIYLNTVSSSQKGATRFITEPKTRDLSDIVVLEKIQPVLGSAALFRDDVWHDGEELVDGVKYLLRTDVMYGRERRLGDGEGEMSFEEFLALRGLGDEERGRKALTVAEGLEDSGKNEEAVVWYKKAYRLWPALEMGG
ncbi:hypothetical protein IFR05_012410 [Cadophora sp. M221]|nr:hypothetical protein IFR05_012410 [Cadophora sp. M221]